MRPAAVAGASEAAVRRRAIRARAEELRARCAPLLAMDDAELGARLLASMPMHTLRSTDRLVQWARVAVDFGHELARRHPDTVDAETWAREQGISIVENDDPVATDQMVIAQFGTRPPTIRLYRATLDFADTVLDALGWRAYYPDQVLRSLAIHHEIAHRLVTGDTGRELKRRLANVVVRIGPLALNGHVLGADELVAHGFAHERVPDLRRSPVLLTAALNQAATLAAETTSGPAAPVRRPTARSTPWAS